MLAFGMVSITRKMFEERQSPEGSFSPRAGTVLNLCLFGSHHDTYCTGYKAMGHHGSHLLSAPEPNSFLPDPHISEWMQ